MILKETNIKAENETLTSLGESIHKAAGDLVILLDKAKTLLEAYLDDDARYWEAKDAIRELDEFKNVAEHLETYTVDPFMEKHLDMDSSNIDDEVDPAFLKGNGIEG